MVTSYFPISVDGKKCFDYSVTPWPLGFINEKGSGKRYYYSCEEDAIGSVEFLGGVDDEFVSKSERIYDEALSRPDIDSYLARGAKSYMASLGRVGTSLVGSLEYGSRLPLGSIVSTVQNGSNKVMVFQHSGSVQGEHYDYGICAWPEGEDPSRKVICLVKKEDITAVHFIGYENALSREIARRLDRKAPL